MQEPVNHNNEAQLNEAQLNKAELNEAQLNEAQLNEAQLNEAQLNEAQFNKPLRLLGMAKKAGLLAIGSDAVKAAARTGKVKLVILASDVSQGSSRQARYSAEESQALCIDTPYTKFDLGSITGRGSPGTVAFLDKGLAEAFMKALGTAQAGAGNNTVRAGARPLRRDVEDAVPTINKKGG